MLPVNTPVEDGQRMNIAGVQLQFFTRHGSDTDDCLTVHLPQHRLVLNNILWPFMPNIYTLRGAKFRDPREWRNALQTILDLEPEVLVNTHARAVTGKVLVASALQHVIDALNFVLDQSLRGILHGLGPEELREFVRLPAVLAAHPNLAEIYGEVSHFGPYLHNHALGWFDGDAASINPLPPLEQAQRLVQAMGGRDVVLRMASEAQARHEYAWAAQLVQYLYRLDPLDAQVRAGKADALHAMGRITPAHTVRSWYLTQARALRDEVDIPRLQFPGPRALAMSPPAVSMDQYRIRIDPTKAGESVLALNLTVSDRAVRHGWLLRRAVATFLPEPATGAAPNGIRAVELECSFEAWLLFFTCRHTLAEFLACSRATQGGIEQARTFFECFDFYAPADNHLVPRA